MPSDQERHPKPRSFLEGLARTFAAADEGHSAAAPEGFYQSVLDALPFAVAVFDAEHRYRFCNPAAIKKAEIRRWIIGKDDFEYCAYRGFDLTLAKTRRQHFLQAVAGRDLCSFEEKLVTSEGQTLYYWRHFFPVFDGADLQLVIGYSMDITELKRAQAALSNLNLELEQRIQERTLELETSNKKLVAMAHYDALTGLPNRTLLKEQLLEAFKTQQRDPSQGFALLFLDADRFKTINDRFGHDAGDDFLKAFGQRLCCCVRGADTVARLGGDEFVILLRVGLAEARQLALNTSERIQTALKYPFMIAGHSLSMSSSIGIVTEMGAYTEAGEVLRDADLAMYQAKRSGRARYVVFAATGDEATEGAREAEKHLR